MSEQHLWNQDARNKLKDMAESIDFAMLATHLDSTPFHAIPMSTKKVDEQGCIWFLSGQDSNHNRFIEQDPRVQLMYAKPGSMEFLNVYGQASITDDRSILESLYETTDDNWFEGVDDPNLTALCIRPAEAYYWDTKSNSLVTLAKIAIGAVTDSEPEVGQEGELNLSR